VINSPGWSGIGMATEGSSSGHSVSVHSKSSFFLVEKVGIDFS